MAETESSKAAAAIVEENCCSFEDDIIFPKGLTCCVHVKKLRRVWFYFQDIACI